MNGDGFSDVLIGALDADPNGYSFGSSYIVFGKASGFDATLDLASPVGTSGFRLNGVAAYDQAGFPVSGAGDVNGDGFSDVLTGAPGAGLKRVYTGASYVVFGKASGFDATMDLSSLDGSNGFRLDGAAHGNLGTSDSGAGDFNGDDFDDLIVATEFAQPNGNYNAGSSYVVFGKAGGLVPPLIYPISIAIAVLDWMGLRQMIDLVRQ